MSHVRTKLTIGATVIIAAVVLLAVAGVRDGWVYYLPVDDFVEQASHTQSRIRLHGTVGEEAFDANPALLTAKFDLLGEKHRVRVEYSGVIPDMFQTGRDVVVEGEMAEDNIFYADSLLTKCASKYEEESEAPHADPYDEESTE